MLARPLSRSCRSALALLAAGLLARSAGPASSSSPAPWVARTAPQVQELARGLADLGPRPAGSPGHEAAAAWLLAAMRRAGLERVRAAPLRGRPGLRNLEGVVPGEPGGGEIVLAAHWDTIAGSPGAGDDASGCAVAIAAAAELRRTPLRHTVRVVLFDGEEAGLHGSRAFLQGRGAAERDALLAALNLEMLGWRESPGATILAWGVPRDGRLAQPPAWLVHALLRAGDAVGWPLALSDPTLPLLAQLVVRSTRPAFGSDADPFIAAGVPAATLSDSPLFELDPAYHTPRDTASRLDPERLARWTELTAAAVRRLDALAGRPLPEDRYLAAFGRVWLHRELLWIGFLLWALLVLRGFFGRRRELPGAEASGSAAVHRRPYPALFFRFLLILAVVTAPLFAVLLWPAAALALRLPRRPALRVTWGALALLPAAFYLSALFWAWSEGLVGPWVPPLPGFALVAAALAAFLYLCARAGAASPASSAIARSHSSSEV
ncbi:MAG TPA: M20/M25/M40 family metallo-hydrolase [Thermoanaerobaculia bacterium]|nr:M20/M25/M40 family metallo-hydrolase [Thermoanaerobaculia bacterium]